MTLLTSEQMQDALLRLEADLLHLETIVGGLASSFTQFMSAERESHARINTSLETLADRQLTTEANLQALADRQLTTDAALNRLVEQIDRFLSGHSGDGRAKP